MSFLGLGKDSLLSPMLPFLEPRLKSNQKDAHSYTPSAFSSRKGRLLIPRMKNPPQPTSEMIAMALSGRLTSFFRDGCIYRASDLVGQVSAQTAKISLDDMYEYQTRQLLTPTTESIKSLRTLFYVALKTDELPSYHFWTAPDGLDPVTAGEPTDWDTEFEKSKPTEWELMQQGANTDDESSVDDLFSDSLAENAQQPGSSTFRERFGKPQRTKHPSPPPSMLNVRNETVTNDEKVLTAMVPSNQPGGMAYARILKLPGLAPEAAGTTPKGSAQRSQAGLGNEKIFTSVDPLIQTVEPVARTPGIEQRLLNPSKASAEDFMVAEAGTLNKEQHTQSSALLRFEWGAMYLENFSHFAFLEMADYLIQHEKDKVTIGTAQRFVDILKSGRRISTEHRVPGSGRKGTHEFTRDIKPYLGLTRHHYRIRSNAYTPSLPFDNSQPGSIKLTRVGIGYCYIDAVGGWNSADFELRMENSVSFEEGINFLFGRDKSGAVIKEDAIPKRLTLEILPQPRTIDFERASDYFMSHDLGEIFHNITSSQLITNNAHESVPWKYSAEVFVHETGERFENPALPAAAAQKLHGHEARDAKEARSMGPELVKGNNETMDKAQQTNRGEWSTTSPRTVFEIVGGPDTPSVCPRVRTQSEIEDLERRLRIAEERPSDDTRAVEVDRMHLERGLLRSQLQGLEVQVNLLTGERDSLGKRVSELDDKADALEQEGDELRSQVKQLEYQAGSLLLARGQLQSRVDELQEEAVLFGKDRESLLLAINNLEDQALGSTRERAQLQSKVVAAERRAYERTLERDRLQMQVDKFARGEFAGLDGDRDAIQAGDLLIQAEPQQPAAVNTAAQSQSKNADIKKLLYCIVCLASVDKLHPNAKAKHAERCSTDVEEFGRLTAQEAKELRAVKKEQKGSKAPTEGADAKTTAVEADQTDTQQSGEAAKSGKQSNASRRDPKRKHGNGDGRPGSEEEEEKAEPPKKKAKSMPAKKQSEDADSEPLVNAGRTRSTRTRDRTYRPPPDEVEEPDDEKQPSSSTVKTKRPRKTSKK